MEIVIDGGEGGGFPLCGVAIKHFESSMMLDEFAFEEVGYLRVRIKRRAAKVRVPYKIIGERSDGINSLDE